MKRSPPGRVAGGSRGYVQLESRRGGDCGFRNILSRHMDSLVKQGLFEPWEGAYRITEKGRAHLAAVERGSKKKNDDPA